MNEKTIHPNTQKQESNNNIKKYIESVVNFLKLQFKFMGYEILEEFQETHQNDENSVYFELKSKIVKILIEKTNKYFENSELNKKKRLYGTITA